MNAVHHPHLLRCEPGVPMPMVGRAIFAQQPAEDDQRRLVYAPLNASNYYETSATLGQYILFKYPPAKFAELKVKIDRVVSGSATRQDKEDIKTFFEVLEPPLPARFNEQIETLGNRGERDYTSLIFAGLQFIGIMVTDNLTDADRKWWAQTGVIQITTCVQGLATVAVTAGTAQAPELVAYEIFAPFQPAYWDCARNELVRPPTPLADPLPNYIKRIGTIVSVGVVEVNILLDTTAQKPAPG